MGQNEWEEIMQGYRLMAEDEPHEREAQEWIEALIGDVLPDEDR